MWPQIMCGISSALWAAFSLCCERSLVCDMCSLSSVFCAVFRLWHVQSFVCVIGSLQSVFCAVFSLCYVQSLVCLLCSILCLWLAVTETRRFASDSCWLLCIHICIYIYIYIYSYLYPGKAHKGHGPQWPRGPTRARPIRAHGGPCLLWQSTLRQGILRQ